MVERSARHGGTNLYSDDSSDELRKMVENGFHAEERMLPILRERETQNPSDVKKMCEMMRQGTHGGTFLERVLKRVQMQPYRR